MRSHPSATAAPTRSIRTASALAAFHSQHVGAWTVNRTGRLSTWNASVGCEWA